MNTAAVAAITEAHISDISGISDRPRWTFPKMRSAHDGAYPL